MQTENKSKNLLILGIVSVGIAITTTVVSLVIYHNSGDIYLDRSRPGFLPDESEVQPQPQNTFVFESSGPINEAVLGEYIDHFEEAVEVIDNLESPFSEAPLSDDSLGIPAPKPEPSEPEE